MGISRRATTYRTVIVDLVKAAATMKERNTNLPLRNYFLLHSQRLLRYDEGDTYNLSMNNKAKDDKREKNNVITSDPLPLKRSCRFDLYNIAAETEDGKGKEYANCYPTPSKRMWINLPSTFHRSVLSSHLRFLNRGYGCRTTSAVPSGLSVDDLRAAPNRPLFLLYPAWNSSRRFRIWERQAKWNCPTWNWSPLSLLL